MFANLAVWLLNQCGRKITQPEEVHMYNVQCTCIHIMHKYTLGYFIVC